MRAEPPPRPAPHKLLGSAPWQHKRAVVWRRAVYSSKRSMRSAGMEAGGARRWLGANSSTLWVWRRLLVVAFLLFSASDARRAVAERSHAHQRVEIRVQDYSFSDGPAEKPEIAINSHDIKGSELHPWPPGNDEELHFTTWEMTEDVSEAEEQQARAPEPPADAQWVAETTQELDARVPRAQAQAQVQAQAQAQGDGGAADSRDASTLKRRTTYRTAMWWWSHEKTELTPQEQAAVLAVVVSLLAVLLLLLVGVWQLARFAWRVFRERRVLRRLFTEPDVATLEAHVAKFPAQWLSLRIKQVACVRLRHLQVVANAARLHEQLEAVAFHEADMALANLPLHAASHKPMTFAEMVAAVDEIACQGEQVAVEILELRVPARWRHYVQQDEWMALQDERLRSLHAESARVQELSTRVSELLMAKLNDGKLVPRPAFLLLLAALRQSSGPQPQLQQQSSGSTSSSSVSESDAFARSWHGSMSLSGSLGSLAGLKPKDEYSFFLKAYDEVAEQHKVRHELHGAIDDFHAAHEPEHEQLLLLEHADGAPTGGNGQLVTRAKRLGATGATGSSITTTVSTRRLEKFVDRAEMLELTHLEEVESAQFMLEDARRDSFCAAVVSKEGKGLESVQALASNFVALGAKRQDAILKAGEILANRSNMLLLVSSLRAMFDELRKRDVMKMNERRHRDRNKAAEKRERMALKFHNKQQLIAEKVERTREMQRQQEEESRLRRRAQELDEWRAQRARERAAYVWKVTKADVLVVLVVMAVVFFENLREALLLKPLCRPDDQHHWWMVSWWAPSSLQVFGCEVTYGMKILGVLLVLGLLFFVVAQLNMAVAVLPVLGAGALYYLRAEWMNMLFRLPLLLLIYGFNSGVLYVLNRLADRRSDEHEAKEQEQQQQEQEQASGATKRHHLLLYVAFPLVSMLLTLVTSVAIACDAPEECVASAYTATVPVLAGLWHLVRGAYRI